MDDCPKCFASQGAGRLEGCPACPYAESCRFCAENPDPGPGRYSKGHGVSVERYQWSQEIATPPDEPDEEADETEAAANAPRYSVREVEELLRFLLRGVDDYSLAVVIAALREGHATAAGLARSFGVSREAMHRKLVDIARRFPQLRGTLLLTLQRCNALSKPEVRHAIPVRASARKAQVTRRGRRGGGGQMDLPLGDVDGGGNG